LRFGRFSLVMIRSLKGMEYLSESASMISVPAGVSLFGGLDAQWPLCPRSSALHVFFSMPRALAISRPAPGRGHGAALQAGCANLVDGQKP
jgi:hypothetical protein